MVEPSPALTNKSIKRRILREMIAHRRFSADSRDHRKSSTPSQSDSAQRRLAADSSARPLRSSSQLARDAGVDQLAAQQVNGAL